MYTSDSEDAFSVVAIIANMEESDASDSYYRKVRSNWEKALSQSEIQSIDLLTAKSIHRSFHGRSVPEKYLNNPVFIGKTNSGRLIALDGSHRLKQHIELENDRIPAIIIDLSWLDDADDMDFDFP